MVTHRRITTLVSLLTILLGACVTEEGQSVFGPSSLASFLTGSLRSASAGSPLPTTEACGDFSWSPSETMAGTYSGDFSATCANDVQLEDTATGILVGDVLNITATGTATQSNLPPCPFTIDGTAQLVNGTIELEYSGTTCLGPISGTEILTAS